MTAAVDFSVVVCTYSEQRFGQLLDAIASIATQRVPAREVIVVVDHNPPLASRLRGQAPEVAVVDSGEPRGLSGARNSGIAAASGEVVAFLDDDAMAHPDWLGHLGAGYRQPKVAGVGGSAHPLWEPRRPPWFPPEFDWVVGCSYRGMPAVTAPVRNLIGCNMSFRRDMLAAVGPFSNGIGRVGQRPVGCEETEYCIRLRQRFPDAVLLYEPAAVVSHRVVETRSRWPYFHARCFAEGLSKAAVTRRVGSGDGLSVERQYATRTLPAAVARGLLDAARLRPAGLARAGAIVSGLSCTACGYAAGRLSGWRRRPQRTR
jgi:GT2 family glycosyltransferase